MQNRLAADGSDDDEERDVLAYCQAGGIAYLPWAPLGGSGRQAAAFERVARAHGATPNQVALAYLLRRAPVIAPIPGTSSIAHLEENVAAASLVLSDDDIAALTPRAVNRSEHEGDEARAVRGAQLARRRRRAARNDPHAAARPNSLRDPRSAAPGRLAAALHARRRDAPGHLAQHGHRRVRPIARRRISGRAPRLGHVRLAGAPNTAPRLRTAPAATSWERVSRRGKLFADVTTRSRYDDKEPRAFQTGVPAIDLFPFATWSRIAATLLRNPPRELVSYSHPAGFHALREAIAAQLRDRKHVTLRRRSGDRDQRNAAVARHHQPADARSRRRGVDRRSRLARGARDVRGRGRAARADPGRRGRYRRGARRRGGAARAPRVRHARGAITDHGDDVAARRAELLAWADAADAWIVEDDYEDIFRYDGEDPAPLHSTGDEQTASS